MPTKVAEYRARAHAAVNYRLRTFAGGRLASHCRPTSIAILLTERCNARCLHCDIWKNRGKEESPSLDQWKTTVRDLRRWLGPVHVVFTGGEALLMPFASEVVSYACTQGLLVEHLTHGYWLDQISHRTHGHGRPRRVTISCDGIGATHDKIRGREHFFDTVQTTIQTLLRLRRDNRLGYVIRLKTVIMEHNLHDVCNVARFAQEHGLEVFYQPIEQNYNTPEDPTWFEHSDNWPKDRERAVAAVQELIELKRRGLPIANSDASARGDDSLLPRSRIAADPHSESFRPRQAPLLGVDDDPDPVQRRRQDVLVHGPDRQHQDRADPPDLGEPSALVEIGMLPGTPDVGGRESLCRAHGRLLMNSTRPLGPGTMRSTHDSPPDRPYLPEIHSP